jgi:hypothetical protein
MRFTREPWREIQGNYSRRESVRNKYHAKRAEWDGRSFHSQGERDCYQYLRLLEQAREISRLECQVSIRLGPRNRRWVLDFKYFDEKLGDYVYADFKGFETDRWHHLIDLWILYGPTPLRVYKGRGLNMTIAEEIIPNAQ